MKTQFFSSRLAWVAFAIGLTFLMSPSVDAGPPAAVTKANTAASILVSVPANGKPVTYRLGGKIWTVNPGKTVVLPAGATQINLPVGSILTTSVPSAKSMGPTKHSYAVNKPITLDSLTPGVIQANLTAFTPGNDPSAAGNIQHPSSTVRGLVNAVTSASSSTINPLNVLVHTAGDSNSNYQIK